MTPGSPFGNNAAVSYSCEISIKNRNDQRYLKVKTLTSVQSIRSDVELIFSNSYIPFILFQNILGRVHSCLQGGP